MRKGISPLISVVLLIAAALVISTIVLTWSSELFKTQQSIIENKTKTSVECSSADITIDSVYLDFTTNISRINIRNSGQADYSVIAASLVSHTGETATYLNSTNLTSGAVSLVRGAITAINFNITNIITSCANFSYALVSTNCVGVSHRFEGNPTCVT